jgi:hypothetical protein
MCLKSVTKASGTSDISFFSHGVTGQFGQNEGHSQNGYPAQSFCSREPRWIFLSPRKFQRKMPPDYLARLFQQRSQARLIRFDEQPVPKRAISDFSEPCGEDSPPVGRSI